MTSSPIKDNALFRVDDDTWASVYSGTVFNRDRS